MNVENEIGISLFNDDCDDMIEVIKESLVDNEKIFTIVYLGRQGSSKMRLNVLVFTDRQLISLEDLILNMGIGKKNMTFKSKEIKRVEYKVSSGIFGIGGGEDVMRIYLKSVEEDNKYKVFFFGKNHTEEIKKLYNDIVSYMNSYDSQNLSTSKSEVSSAADEIKKLAELRDSGIITHEEFEAKKKQLLDL